MKSCSTFKIPRNVGGNGYWSILIPRVPNQVMTLKCAVMCVPLQYKPSVQAISTSSDVKDSFNESAFASVLDLEDDKRMDNPSN